MGISISEEIRINLLPRRAPYLYSSVYIYIPGNFFSHNIF